MTQIFISYRRDDSQAVADRIQDRLADVFGGENVFQDVEDIPMGTNFKHKLEQAVKSCDVLLVIIGPDWVSIKDQNGKRRLDDPGDFVRIEIEAGLSRENVLVIPVLVQNAIMPRDVSLPASLRPLYYLNAAKVRNNPDFSRDVTALIDHIHQYMRTRSPTLIRRILLLLLAGIVLVGAAFVLEREGNEHMPDRSITATDAPSRVLPTQTLTSTNTPVFTPDALIAALLPAVLYPEGRHVQLRYDAGSFYLANSGNSRISVSRLSFEAVDSTGTSAGYRFDGGLWARFYGYIDRDRCGSIEILGVNDYLRPEICNEGYSVTNTPGSISRVVFWIGRENIPQFRVLWNDIEVGRCEINANECEVFLPRS